MFFVVAVQRASVDVDNTHRRGQCEVLNDSDYSVNQISGHKTAGAVFELKYGADTSAGYALADDADETAGAKIAIAVLVLDCCLCGHDLFGEYAVLAYTVFLIEESEGTTVFVRDHVHGLDYYVLFHITEF